MYFLVHEHYDMAICMDSNQYYKDLLIIDDVLLQTFPYDVGCRGCWRLGNKVSDY